MESLVFQTFPEVTLGGNVFKNTPVVLQFDDTPLLEVIKGDTVGRTTRFNVYGSDGTDFGRIVGVRFFPTSPGKKAGVSVRHEQDLVVAELGGQQMFEMRRIGPAALAASAELYTPTGHFVRASQASLLPMLDPNHNALQVMGMVMRDSTIDGCRIGIWLKSDGSLAVGVGGGSIAIGSMSA